MTEIYQGPWDPVTGDRPKKVQEDPYHPRYPDAKDTKVEGILNGPMSGAYKVRDVFIPVVKGS